MVLLRDILHLLIEQHTYDMQQGIISYVYKVFWTFLLSNDSQQGNISYYYEVYDSQQGIIQCKYEVFCTFLLSKPRMTANRILYSSNYEVFCTFLLSEAAVLPPSGGVSSCFAMASLCSALIPSSDVGMPGQNWNINKRINKSDNTDISTMDEMDE